MNKKQVRRFLYGLVCWPLCGVFAIWLWMPRDDGFNNLKILAFTFGLPYLGMAFWVRLHGSVVDELSGRVGVAFHLTFICLCAAHFLFVWLGVLIVWDQYPSLDHGLVWLVAMFYNALFIAVGQARGRRHFPKRGREIEEL